MLQHVVSGTEPSGRDSLTSPVVQWPAQAEPRSRHPMSHRVPGAAGNASSLLRGDPPFALLNPLCRQRKQANGFARPACARRTLPVKAGHLSPAPAAAPAELWASEHLCHVCQHRKPWTKPLVEPQRQDVSLHLQAERTPDHGKAIVWRWTGVAGRVAPISASRPRRRLSPWALPREAEKPGGAVHGGHRTRLTRADACG